jgi:hypothetical protein
MEFKVQYLYDKDGIVKAVQIPIKDWKWLQSKFRIFTKELALKKDLEQAISEVAQMQDGTMKKQPLGEFLAEL